MSDQTVDSREPIRIDERRLFSGFAALGINNKSNQLTTPAGFNGVFAEAEHNLQPVVYATDISRFTMPNKINFTDALYTIAPLEMYTDFLQANRRVRSNQPLEPTIVALSGLTHLLKLKEKSALSFAENTTTDLEQAMIQDDIGKELGLKKKRRLFSGSTTEASALMYDIYRMYNPGNEPTQKTIENVVGDNIADFTDHVSRLRVGAEITGQDLHRLAAIKALDAATEFYMDTRKGRSRPAVMEAARRIKDTIDPTANLIADRSKSVLNYIQNADLRLVNESEVYHVFKPDGSLPDKINEDIMRAQERYNSDIKNRFDPDPTQTFAGTPIEYKPSYPYLARHIFTQERESIKIADEPAEAPKQSIDPDVLERFKQQQAAHREERRLERIARRKARMEQGSENDPTSAELVEYLNGLVAEQAEVLAPYRAQSSKQLRGRGIVGADSLEYHLRQSKLRHDDGFDRVVRLYDGLGSLVTTAEEPAEDMKNTLSTLDDIADAYWSKLKGNSTLHVQSLQPGLRADLEWLDQNWTGFIEAAQASKNRAAVPAETQRMIRELLDALNAPEAVSVVESEEPEESEATGIDTIRDEINTIFETEQETEKEESSTPDVPLTTGEIAVIDRDERNELDIPLDAITRANVLAEQLDWVVLPDHELSPDDLIHIAKTSLGGGITDHAIDRERMVRLLAFRSEYGGALYRSSERMLGDSNNLYFVLTFTHPGDDNTYAIAENVVHGNATYVLREDTMPLNPGESVLTAVKLSRKDVRDLGAKRIIHTTGGRDHSEKLIDAMNELSLLDSVL